MKFIFGAGGTGGHITPALALADELIKHKHNVLFLGNAKALKKRFVLRQVIPFGRLKCRNYIVP